MTTTETIYATLREAGRNNEPCTLTREQVGALLAELSVLAVAVETGRKLERTLREILTNGHRCQDGHTLGMLLARVIGLAEVGSNRADCETGYILTPPADCVACNLRSRP